MKTSFYLIIMASWCPDCQEQVPRFYKILDDAGIKDKSLNPLKPHLKRIFMR